MLQPSQPIRVPFGQTLLAIQAQLVTASGLPTTNVKLIGRGPGSVPHTVGDMDLLVRPSSFITPQDEEDSTGRISSRQIRTIYVCSRVRMARDEFDRDTQWLTDPVNGIFALEDLVLNGLFDWIPVDGDGNHLTTRGLWLVSGNEAEKDELKNDVRAATSGKKDVWGDSIIAFSANYLPNIDVGEFGVVT